MSNSDGCWSLLPGGCGGCACNGVAEMAGDEGEEDSVLRCFESCVRDQERGEVKCIAVTMLGVKRFCYVRVDTHF